MNNFPEVFNGIGKHKYRKITLNVDRDVKPVIQPPRRTALPLRNKADKVIKKYHEEDILEDMNGPTEWLSNPVYTPKADPNEIR